MHWASSYQRLFPSCWIISLGWLPRVSGHNVFMALDGCCHIILLKGYINLNCHQSCMHVPISKQLCWHSFLVLIFANYIARKWLLNIALICISLITRENKTFSLRVCLLFVFPHELCWSFWSLIPGNLTLQVESCSKVVRAQWVWEPKHTGDPHGHIFCGHIFVL